MATVVHGTAAAQDVVPIDGVAQGATATIPVAASPAAPVAAHPQPGYGFAPTVGALLRADADKALAAALGQDAPGAKPVAPSVEKKKPVEQVSLLGIYGRAGAWRADVAINGVSVVLAAGDSFQDWRARSVDNRCVVLAKAGQTRKLCGTR
ncbi:hypothetical protein D8I35_03315 [Corticibacter populi]|uniref:Uncharacterized protein n=1 Tax=Corticibacter populi TaxID=1550736 RepID=A0A3M6QZW7_9BURK|nr:hypothetical protein D8I35_03315 [Corticibacter populi]